MEFLQSRHLEHLQEVFFAAKLDDSVASKLPHNKLLELGLVYGDIIAFKMAFPDASAKGSTSYFERAKELKTKLGMVHSKKNDKLERPILIKNVFPVNVSLKCKEKDKYVLKTKTHVICDIPVTTQYDELHDIARSKLHIHKATTYLGSYKNQSWEGRISTLQDFITVQKEKKKQAVIYVFYPNTYNRYLLERETFPNFQDSSSSADDDPIKICHQCSKQYLSFCFTCEWDKEQAEMSEMLSLDDDDCLPSFVSASPIQTTSTAAVLNSFIPDGKNNSRSDFGKNNFRSDFGKKIKCFFL